jgi:hypothetical protein
MLAFYLTLIPPTHAKLRAVLYGVIGFTASGWLITAFAITFWCGPDPSINWYAALMRLHALLKL